MQKSMSVFYQVVAVTAVALVLFWYVTLYASAGETETNILAAAPASKGASRSSHMTERTGQDTKAAAFRQDSEERMAKTGEDTAVWLQLLVKYIRKQADVLVGTTLVFSGLICGIRLMWQSSVLLYCYDGGDEYRRLGLLYLKKGKKELELFLPDYLVETAGTPRYRLVLKNSLVKKCKDMDLVVKSEEHKLRQPLEECVDFVL